MTFTNQWDFLSSLRTSEARRARSWPLWHLYHRLPVVKQSLVFHTVYYVKERILIFTGIIFISYIPGLVLIDLGPLFWPWALLSTWGPWLELPAATLFEPYPNPLPSFLHVCVQQWIILNNWHISSWHIKDTFSCLKVSFTSTKNFISFKQEGHWRMVKGQGTGREGEREIVRELCL